MFTKTNVLSAWIPGLLTLKIQGNVSLNSITFSSKRFIGCVLQAIKTGQCEDLGLRLRHAMYIFRDDVCFLDGFVFSGKLVLRGAR